MSQSINKQFILHFLLLGGFALIAMLSAFCYGITSGNDLFQHYQFALAIKESIGSGELYPSFASSLNNGFGDVALRFYPPLSYYVLNLFHFLTGEWYFASQIQFFFVFFLGGLGTYLWAKEEFSPHQSLLAGAIYTFAPYHLNQIYNNFLFAEFNSTAILPFCFLFVTRICRKNEKADLLGLTIAYAFLILTHLPLTIICSLMLGLYAVLLLPRERLFSTLLKLSTTVISALILTSFYWSRLITEINWVKHSSPKYFSEIWSYQTNFLFQIESIINFQDDVLNLWLADLMLLTIVLISIPSLVFLIKKRFAVSRLELAVFAVFIFSIFMTLPLSNFVWSSLPFLQKVQFPWRWLGIISLFGSLFSSIGIIQISETLRNTKNILIPLGVGLIFFVFVFTSSIIIKGAVYNSRTEFNQRFEALETAESFDCWWTVWAEKSAFQQKEKVTAPNREVKLQTWEATDRSFTISPGEAQTVNIATFYYPHWKATVNGQNVPISASPNGTISFLIPAEEIQVRLFFEEPGFVQRAFKISIIGWIIILILLPLSRFKRPTNQ